MSDSFVLHPFLRRWVNLLTGVALLGFAGGCQPTPAGGRTAIPTAPAAVVQADGMVLVRTSAEPGSVLVSEIDPTKPVVFEFELRSTIAEACDVQVVDLGCGSCFRLSHLGATQAQELKRGSTILLPKQGSVQLRAEWKPTPKAERQSQFFRLRRQRVNDATGTVDLEGKLELDVLGDLAATPSALTLDLPEDSVEMTRQVELVRRVRGSPLAEAPRFHDLPVNCRLVSLRETSTFSRESALVEQKWLAELAVRLPEGVPAWSANLVATHGNGPAQTCPIPLSIRKAQGLVAIPAAVSFGPVSIGKPVTRKVRLTATDQIKFKVLAVSSTHHACSATFITGQAADRHWLTCSCQATSTGEVSGELVVLTDHPKARRLILKIEGIARP